MPASARFAIDPTELTGRRALVTGGTQGVGAAIVSRLVAAGARVATTACSEGQHSNAFDLFVRADVGTSDGAHEAARWAHDCERAQHGERPKRCLRCFRVH